MKREYDTMCVFTVLLSLLLFVPSLGYGQDTDTNTEEEKPSDADLYKLLEEQAKLNEEQAKLNEEQTRLNKEQAQKIEELVAFQEQQQMDELESELDEDAKGQIFSLWGFMDVSFNKYFFKKNSSYNLYISRHPSFFMTNLNLYFGSQMTDTLDTLIELRFSFLPNGLATDYEYSLLPGSEYQRIDTTVVDPANVLEFRQHGLTIERARMNWSPRNWFGVMAGRYLTPYGIWNVDHGSPVVLSIRLPYLQQRGMVPPAQTGLQIYGRLFPAKNLYFDYAATVSNGRGPTDDLFDLDNNKALGLKLKLSYESSKFKIALGSYGYWGKVTNYKEVVDIDLQDDGTLDRDANMPIRISEVTTEAGEELVVTVDFLLEVAGFRLQAEYIGRRMIYSIPPEMSPNMALFSGISLLDTGYLASYTGWGLLGIISYQLPLDRWLGNVNIIPYVVLDSSEAQDTVQQFSFNMILWGLNIRPSPFVTIKVEGGIAQPKFMENVMGSKLYSAGTQLAVSF